MTTTKRAAANLPARAQGQFFLVAGLLLAVLGFLFFRSLLPGQTLFNNDGPLGAQVAACHQLPGIFTGDWEDLNSIGSQGGSAWPDLTYGLKLLVGSLWFSKLHVPFALFFLGLSAWLCLREFGLTPRACLLGGVAAALNSLFLSAACWGVAAQPICFGLNYLALAALADTASRFRWLRVVLAGLAVGMGVMEGADIGAIFSLFVAAFVVYQAWVSDGAPVKRGLLGLGRLAVVAGFAAFIAAQSITVLVGTQIKGIAGMEQTAEARSARWDEATQWSLPKREALGLIVPGLFGYRMDTPGGGNYWGAAGRDAAWDRYFAGGEQGPRPGGFLRYSGGGIYAGVLVVLIAVWAGAQALRRQGSVFSPANRKLIGFWLGVLLVSLLLAFGRYAPFYQFLYALPYFSTIRNPAKFMDVFNWGLILLFGYGVHGLSRRYLEVPASGALPLSGQLRTWWGKVKGFDRRWTVGSGLALGLSLLGWLLYSSGRSGLESYLAKMSGFEGRSPEESLALAQAVAGFSIRQVGWFILFLVPALGAVTLILSGYFSGPRAKWAGLLLGVLVVVDLARANQPWIIYWNYQQKYASNPVMDLLRDKPYEHRAAALPDGCLLFRLPPQLATTEHSLIASFTTSNGCNSSSSITTSSRWTSFRCRACRWTYVAFESGAVL